MFDYSQPDVPASVVSEVVASIRSEGTPPELSDEEREARRVDREIYLWKCRQREEEWQAEREHRQAVADEAARQEEAAEIAERNRQKRLQQQREYQERQEQRSRSLDLSALKFEAQQSAAWRNMVQGSIRQQHVQSLYGELEKMLCPPAEPESQLVDDTVDVASEGSAELGDRDFNPALFNKKPRPWF